MVLITKTYQPLQELKTGGLLSSFSSDMNDLFMVEKLTSLGLLVFLS